ncbi:CREB-regulated transcription coactivator 1-like isoform X2 [Pecten maximus]|uniref:CREB-regulated transcription coactivator 1-like isoform X2 n=1 Tax=Pecten maximus TaxID=6579 RepID=UPI0014585D65|nr:CREB-regulated transcription coactivator 1-like isoform X2 [Pecten maximus]
MANPRKFSEKIALHNQKQAEETAAFEAIIRDVSAATRGSPSYSTPNQHLQLQQNIMGQYRAGSLPNVNQMAGNSAVDLQTTLQHFDDIRGGPVHNRGIDRLHNRDRGRQLGPHRRAFPMDKQRADCSPYGSAFLTPPPDTSWRRLFRHLNGPNLSRTNSDSALHTSAMAPISDLGDHMHGATTPPVNRRLMEVAGENAMQGGALMKEFWDPKKLVAQSRPKSCEVPNINIYPSTEQENQGTGIHVPITNNTGSLPDLTVLHFPPPLATPLDAEDQSYQGGQAPPGSAPANLSPTSAHRLGGMGPPSPQAQSPVQRRRLQHGGPSPLVLSGSPTQQMRMSHSTPDSVPNLDPSKLSLDPRLKQQYLLYLHQQQQQRQRGGHTRPPAPSNNNLRQVPQVHITSACDQNNSQPSLTQYRNNVSESNCQSPTSPLSQTSHSPAQSPGLPPTSWNNSPFTENYQHQQQQQQTNALQHQFEQFNMSQDNHFISSSSDSSLLTNGATSTAIYTSPQNTSINFSQAITHGLSGSNQDLHQQYFPQQLDSERISQKCVVNPAVQYQHLQQQSAQQQQNILQQQQQQQQQQHVSSSGKIPDIIFTGINSYLFPGVDDNLMGKQDFAKELGNAITGMPDGFDTEFFTSDEALKVGLDPLDLDGLQMLTDPSMLTDPATEESFKLDRL